MVTRYSDGMVAPNRYRNGRSSVAGAGLSGAAPAHSVAQAWSASVSPAVITAWPSRPPTAAPAAERPTGALAQNAFGGGGGEPVDQPGLAVVVVHRERAPGVEVVAGLG